MALASAGGARYLILMLRGLSRLFSAFWPIGLFAFFLLIALSFEDIEQDVLAQIFGAIVIFCAALAWLILDWVKPSESRTRQKLAEMADLLRPYEGLSLKQMPPEVQAEVHKRLGWTIKPPPAPKK